MKREDKRRKELLVISNDSSVEATEKRKEAIHSRSSFESSEREGSPLEMSEDHSKEKISRHGRDGRARDVENVPGGTLKPRFRNVQDMGAVAMV
jgi:hypothetical protein